LLEADGHVVLTPTLTGLGDRSHLIGPQVGLDCHVEDVLATLSFARLEDVVLVAHSYAGLVIAGVASRRPEAIRRLIYLDAFVPGDGEPGIDLLPETVAHHYRASTSERGFGWLIPQRSLEVLGVTDPDDVAWLEPRLVPHPFKTYTDAANVSGESLDIPSAFVECTEWMGVFHPYAERAAQRGWPVRTLATGHEAMVTAPAELAAVLAELAALPTDRDDQPPDPDA
jgi:pimeloyl-ACP methyl ester carboxylesterase